MSMLIVPKFAAFTNCKPAKEELSISWVERVYGGTRQMPVVVMTCTDHLYSDRLLIETCGLQYICPVSDTVAHCDDMEGLLRYMEEEPDHPDYWLQRMAEDYYPDPIAEDWDRYVDDLEHYAASL